MNGYPDHVIEKTIVHKLKDFTSPTSHTVKKCPIYLHSPYLEASSVRNESKIKASVENFFFALEQRVVLVQRKRVVFTSCPLLAPIKKNV